MNPISQDPDTARALADPTVAFSCDCSLCEESAPLTLREATRAGWHEIQYVGDDFCSRNYLGLCPVCSMIEANA